MNRPVIKAATSFLGLGVMTSDVYINGGGGKEWYTNQNNFFRQIRHFVIDMRDVHKDPSGLPTAGIHWQMAQVTRYNFLSNPCHIS